MLELKIANKVARNSMIEERRGGLWKFILTHEGNAIVLYTEPPTEEGRILSHRLVGEKYGISPEDILGGGQINYILGNVEIGEESTIFGPAPQKVMESFAEELTAQIRELYDVKETTVNMSKENITPGLRERWQELGFSFD